MNAIYKGKIYKVADDGDGGITLVAPDSDAEVWASYSEPSLIIDPTDQQVLEVDPDFFKDLGLISETPDYGVKLPCPPEHRDTRIVRRMTQLRSHVLEYGAYDSTGKLRATFDSEAEAYHYVRNRGHMDGGSSKKIERAGRAKV